jgi:hypothetical protein
MRHRISFVEFHEHLSWQKNILEYLTPKSRLSPQSQTQASGKGSGISHLMDNTASEKEDRHSGIMRVMIIQLVLYCFLTVANEFEVVPCVFYSLSLVKFARTNSSRRNTERNRLVSGNRLRISSGLTLTDTINI